MKKYNTPSVSVVVFAEEDVVRTSFGTKFNSFEIVIEDFWY